MMLLCKQVKLSERRSGQQFNRCNPLANSVVIRPCTLKNITEVPLKSSNSIPITEKRSPELRVVSLNFEDELYTKINKKIIKSPHRMPLYCIHFKRTQRMNHKDEKDLEDDFLVRGVEVGSGNGNGSPAEKTDVLNSDDEHQDEFRYLQNGIQIRLTDCCQCVCDLFNYSSFQTSHDDGDFSFVTMDGGNSSRSIRSKEVDTRLKNNLLDPDVLKVIRVTMNSKN